MSIFERTGLRGPNEGASRSGWLAAFLTVLFTGMVLSTVQADAQTRSLKLYNTHTKERAEITYKQNGRFTENGLRQMNQFFRDWRQNEPTNMDPRLFDMLYDLYRDTNASQPIHVVSAYRSPKTNSMLRSRSSGVADNSQHTRGNAIDFFIPGVNTSELRQRALRMNGGGVGYYPRSGTPFVHIDVGGVRHWPRMNRNQLMAVFPDGKTMHLPSDGRPLPGYQQAKAEYEQRQRGGDVQVARGDGGSSGGLLATLFGNRGSGSQSGQQQQAAQPAVQTAQRPAQQAQPQQQQQQQQPRQEQPAQTPQTILAALPERSVPVPLAAPRPGADVGAPQVTQAEQAVEIEQAIQQAEEQASPESAETQMANVPLPTRRPDDAPQMTASVEAEEVDDSDVTVAAITGNLPSSGGVEAIGELLAMRSADARAGRAPDTIPVPSLRTTGNGPVTADAGEQLAALVSGVQATAATLSDAGQERPRLAGLPPAASEDSIAVQRSADPRSLEEKRQRMAALSEAASASPRVAVLNRSPGSDALSAANSGVRTTAKSGRPQPGQTQRQRRAAPIPVEGPMKQWAFARDMGVITASNGANGSSARSQELVMARPNQVYTTGFQQGNPEAQSNRFTGNAVRFLSVARFGQ